MRQDAKRDQIGDNADSVGWTASFLADEKEHGRRLLVRLCSWAGVAILAVASAVLVNHTSRGLRGDRLAYAELSQQAQQLQFIAKDAQDEAKRLSAAVNTLNGDRDRLYTRVTAIEQGLDSVTGSIGKQPVSQSLSWPNSFAMPVMTAPPVISAVATSASNASDSAAAARPVTAPSAESAQKETVSKEQSSPPLVQLPVMQTKPPEPSAQASVPKSESVSKPVQTASLSPAPPGTGSPASMTPPSSQPAAAQSQGTVASVQRTDFGVDLGSANSIEGLRAIWRGSLKGWPTLVGELQPLIVVKEGNDGLGLRLHIVAGPLHDAAAAAKLCANLIASRHSCETAVFDGQRLALDAPQQPAAAVPVRDKPRRKPRPRAEKPVAASQLPPQPAPQVQASNPPAPQTSGLSSLFGSR